MVNLCSSDVFTPTETRRSALVIRSVLNAVALLLVGMSLIACGRDIQDLQQYVEEVKAREFGAIPDPPRPAEIPIFPYQAQNLRDPFDPSELSDKFEDRKLVSTKNQVFPDPHVPEYLESFPLDSLRMVGTMSQGGALWALIKTPDSTIQRVTQGNYLGQNDGKIKDITDDKIYLTEIISDGIDGWIRRDGTIALRE
jgi:type IV pilus assembly protein PilP